MMNGPTDEDWRALRQLRDRVAVQDRVVRTCTALDQRDWAAYVACYTDDATIGYSHQAEPVAPRDFAAAVAEAYASYSVVQHFALNFTVEIGEGRATCRCYAVGYHCYGSKLRSAPWRAASAIYADELVEIDGAWLIRSRRAELQWEDGASA